jgi:hypothetical protein
VPARVQDEHSLAVDDFRLRATCDSDAGVDRGVVATTVLASKRFDD